MAGDWMKVEVALPDKPEVWQIAEALNLDPDAVVGKLIRIWRWFDQQSRDGNAPSVTKKLLDRDVGVTGFMDAMEKAGWLECSGDSISVPNFDIHNSKSAKNRALTQKRVKRHRNDDSVTSALPEKRREENINIGDIPAWIDDSVWQEFQQHRREIRAKLTPTATARLIANLDKHRALGADPNEALRQSIENQWRGVFPERLLEKGNGRSGKGTVRETNDERRAREADEYRRHILAN